MGDVLKSAIVSIGDSSTELLSAVEGGHTIIQMLQIGNVDGANSATFDLSINKNNAGDVSVMKAVTVDAGKSIVVYSDANGKLYLNDDGTNDTLDAIASVAGDLVATISYIERTT